MNYTEFKEQYKQKHGTHKGAYASYCLQEGIQDSTVYVPLDGSEQARTAALKAREGDTKLYMDAFKRGHAWRNGSGEEQPGYLRGEKHPMQRAAERWVLANEAIIHNGFKGCGRLIVGLSYKYGRKDRALIEDLFQEGVCSLMEQPEGRKAAWRAGELRRHMWQYAVNNRLRQPYHVPAKLASLHMPGLSFEDFEKGPEDAPDWRQGPGFDPKADSSDEANEMAAKLDLATVQEKAKEMGEDESRFLGFRLQGFNIKDAAEKAGISRRTATTIMQKLRGAYEEAKDERGPITTIGDGNKRAPKLNSNIQNGGV